MGNNRGLSDFDVRHRFVLSGFYELPFQENRLVRGWQLGLINQIHAALVSVSTGRLDTPSEPARPAVSVKKSMTPDYLVCLEDGKRFKSLKRHLRSTYNMTPDEYRAKWSLPADYPMVAPSYAEQRSEFAKKIGLGRGTGRQSARRSSGNGAGAKK